MQIILIPDRLSAARTIRLHTWHVITGLGLLALGIAVSAVLLSWFSIQWRLPVVQEMIFAMQGHEAQQTERFVTGNLQSLANRLGELQARMTQLDALSRRLSKEVGIGQPEDPKQAQEPQGGPFVPAPLDETSLQQEIDRLSRQIQEKTQALENVAFSARENRVRQSFLPTTLPVAGGAYLGSPFGPRIDPFGRGRAIHEGLDFVAPYGTPVLAAAGGVVVYAAYHPEFGNLVEVNHGGEQITRYAHLSSLSVNVGSVVRRGQEVGLLGSTGRSTGPHLHFEVRKNGVARDPAPFLANHLAPPKTP